MRAKHRPSDLTRKPPKKNRPTDAWRNYLTGDVGKGDVVAKRITLGRRTALPLYALGGYVLSGALLCGGAAQPFGTTLRAPLLISAILAFLAGALVHILDKISRHSAAMLTKIDDSVGDVYQAGGRARERRLEFEAEQAASGNVRRLIPRR